jgi:hypothetical protein
VQHVAAVATVGALLVGLLAGRAATVDRGDVALVALPATAWALAALASVVVGLAEITGRPLSAVLDVDLVRSYVEQVASGRALLWTALLAAGVALAASSARLLVGRAALLVLALSALVPTLRTGHSATASDHTLSVTATSVHVVAAVLWVGGLAALVASARRPSLGVVLPRFSALALLCFVAVVGFGRRVVVDAAAGARAAVDHRLRRAAARQERRRRAARRRRLAAPAPEPGRGRGGCARRVPAAGRGRGGPDGRRPRPGGGAVPQPAVTPGPAAARSLAQTGGSVSHIRAIRSSSIRWSLSTCWANW